MDSNNKTVIYYKNKKGKNAEIQREVIDRNDKTEEELRKEYQTKGYKFSLMLDLSNDEKIQDYNNLSTEKKLYFFENKIINMNQLETVLKYRNEKIIKIE